MANSSAYWRTPEVEAYLGASSDDEGQVTPAPAAASTVDTPPPLTNIPAEGRAPPPAQESPSYWRTPEIDDYLDASKAPDRTDMGPLDQMGAAFHASGARWDQAYYEIRNKLRLGTQFGVDKYLDQSQIDDIKSRPDAMEVLPGRVPVMVHQQAPEQPSSLSDLVSPQPLPKTRPSTLGDWLAEMRPDQRQRRDADILGDPDYQAALQKSKEAGRYAQQNEQTLNWLGKITEMGLTLAPALGLGAVVSEVPGGAGLVSTALTMGVLGGQQYGDMLADGREMGLDEETAADRAGILTLATTAPYAAPIPGLLGEVVGPSFIKNLMKTGFSQAGAGVTSHILATGLDAGLFKPGASFKDAMSAMATPEGLLELGKEGLTNFGVGLLLGGPGAYRGKKEFQRQQGQQTDLLKMAAEMEEAARKQAAEAGGDSLDQLHAAQGVVLEFAKLNTSLDRTSDADQQALLDEQIANETLSEMERTGTEPGKLQGEVDLAHQQREDEARQRIAGDIATAEADQMYGARTVAQRNAEEAPGLAAAETETAAQEAAAKAVGERPINPAMARAMIAAGYKPSEVVRSHEEKLAAEQKAAEAKAVQVQPGEQPGSPYFGAERAARGNRAETPEAAPVGKEEVPAITEEEEPGAPGFQLKRLPTAEEVAAKKEAQTAAIDTAAEQAGGHEATPAQAEAGNYQKGHATWNGLRISIENAAGSIRKGVDKLGNAWSQKMRNHYGYIRLTDSAEGPKEKLDTFLGPDPTSDRVFVVDAVDPSTGAFDEHKAMIGFHSNLEAIRAYKANYPKGHPVGKVTEMSAAEFKEWALTKGNKDVGLHPETPAPHHVVSPAEAAHLEERAATRRPRRDKGVTRYSYAKGEENTPTATKMFDTLRQRWIEVPGKVFDKKTQKWVDSPEAIQARRREENRADEVVGAANKAMPALRARVTRKDAVPAKLQAALDRLGKKYEDLNGIYHNGEVHVFADNHATPKEVMQAVLHEGVTHHGLRVLTGGDERVLDNLLDRVYEGGDKAQIHDIGDKYELDMTTDAGRREATEEFMAHLSERGDPDNVLQRVYSWVRNQLRKMGVVHEWTDGDIRALLREAARSLKGKPIEKLHVESEVQVAETGEIVNIKEPAHIALRQLDKRMSVIRQLKACL
jgi:hypothetical protein